MIKNISLLDNKGFHKEADKFDIQLIKLAQINNVEQRLTALENIVKELNDMVLELLRKNQRQ